MTLNELIDRLAAVDPVAAPFISLYVNTQPDETGRENYHSFLRKQMEEITGTFPPHSPEHDSLTRDVERIKTYLMEDVRKSANGVAIFACAAADFFEAIQLDAPIERHRLSVSNYPDIYPLARLADQYPAYAALVADTNTARIFVFSLNRQLSEEEISGQKTNRSQVGGWSQARYQRHIDNIHAQHAKETVEALERIVREERIEHILLAGDEVVIPLLREQMSQQLAEKIVDVLRLDIKTPEHEILLTTLEHMREQNTEEDIQKVQQLVNEYRAGGLGVVGVQKTRAALEIGQVDELLISALSSEIKGKPAKTPGVPRMVKTPSVVATAVATGTPEVETNAVAIADELVLLARRTAAKVTFIEDPALLAEFGGVGALLRFKL